MINKKDVLDILNEFPEHIKEGVKTAKKAKIKISGKINKVVICGVGVAGNAADICSALTNKIPIFSCKDYKVPGFTDKNTLVIVLSYSGISETTMSAFNDAKRKKAKVVCVTGKKDLAKRCKSVLIPEKLIPRFSFPYLLMGAVVVLSQSNIIPNVNMTDINKVLSQKQCSRKGFLLSKNMKGKFPLVYSAPEYEPLAYRIKSSVNEKSKSIAFSNIVTDVPYNEMLSYKRFPRKFEIVLIRDSKENKDIKNHMNAFKKTMKNKNISELSLKGKSVLAKLLYGAYVGDYLAYYLALMNREDPFNIKIISEFKENLK